MKIRTFECYLKYFLPGEWKGENWWRERGWSWGEEGGVYFLQNWSGGGLYTGMSGFHISSKTELIISCNIN